MKSAFKVLGWTALVGVVLCLVMAAILAATMGSIGPGTIEIDGDTVRLSDAGIGHGLIALVGVAAALLVVLVVVPVAVLVPLLLVVLALGAAAVVALVAVTGAVALLFSPLLLLLGAVWLVVRLLRKGRATDRAAPDAHAPTTPGATIAG